MTFAEGYDIISVMKKNYLSKISYMIIAMMTCVLLAGCSLVPSLNLTQEQEDLIAEYAAGQLVKYEKGHAMGMVPVTAEELTEEPEVSSNDMNAGTEIPVQTEDSEDHTQVEEPGTPVVDDFNYTSESLGGVVPSNVPIGQVFGVEGFDITYSNFELQKIYPPQEDDNLIFSMQASNGKLLLVVHFNLTNGNDSACGFDAASSDIKARISVNGGERIPAQTTILLNDLLTYRDEIAPFAMVDSVMVFEVPESYESGINSLNLILVGPSGENEYILI